MSEEKNDLFKENKIVGILTEHQKESIRNYFKIDTDSKLLSPIVDYTFKRLFIADDKRSKIALIDFLNSVLAYENAYKIVDLKVVNPDIPVDRISQKKSVFDIRVTYNNGEQAIIEMQTTSHSSFNKRSQHIISKAFSSQDISGHNYHDLKSCVLVCITNFDLFKGKEDIITDYRFRDKSGNDLSDSQTIVFLELPKVDKILNKPVSDMTNIEMWAMFFRYVTDKDKRDILELIIKREDGINMASQILEEISQSEKERMQYESELIFALDQATREYDYKIGIKNAEQRGIEEGKIKGKIENALKSIEKGYALGIIQDITGLELTFLEELKSYNGNIKLDEAIALYKKYPK